MGDSPEGRRRHSLRKMGLTVDNYGAMLKWQGGRCAICRAYPTDRRLAVDHDHYTEDIRGLLCTRCNLVLGFFDDDVDLFRESIDYLLNGGFIR